MQTFAKNIAVWKSATSLASIGILFCAVGGSALAKPPARGGGHPAPRAAVAHFSAPRAAPHFAARPHFAPHVAARPHFAPHVAARPHFAPHIAARPHITPHISTSHVRHFASPSIDRGPGARFTHRGTPSGGRLTTTARPLVGTRGAAFAHHHAIGGADPAAFTAHRHFAGDPALRPFLRRGWHPYHHLGWVGPQFWPYAYGDFFYYALWPYDYEDIDPVWAYGYGDIYESIFSPYDYSDYVQGSGAPERMASLTQGMTQSCTDEAAEVTGWPINQIQDAVQPSPQQSALLDDLGNAVVKASDEVKSHCPTTVAFTPTDRLGQMQQRLQGLVDAVNIVSPPLAKFYDALSDEQKARFDDIAPPQPPPGAQASQAPSSDAGQSAPSVQTQCDASVMAFPTDRVDDVVHPNDAQRAKLTALQSALAQAATAVKAACPSQPPATPTGRLAAIGQRLQAMLQGVETVQPALADFYNSLNDDQKARFNTMGKQLFAQNQ
jgi:hypothetical protein